MKGIPSVGMASAVGWNESFLVEARAVGGDRLKFEGDVGSGEMILPIVAPHHYAALENKLGAMDASGRRRAKAVAHRGDRTALEADGKLGDVRGRAAG